MATQILCPILCQILCQIMTLLIPAEEVLKICFAAAEESRSMSADMQRVWQYARENPTSELEISGDVAQSLQSQEQGDAAWMEKYTIHDNNYVRESGSWISKRDYASIAREGYLRNSRTYYFRDTVITELKKIEANKARILAGTSVEPSSLLGPNARLDNFRGMENHGQTCWLNSAIKLLLQCEDLVSEIPPSIIKSANTSLIATGAASPRKSAAISRNCTM